MVWYIILAVVVLFFVYKLFIKGAADRHTLDNRDELLRFFAPNEKLMASQVAKKIRERTEGRRDISDAILHRAFSQLCSEGKLIKEVTQKTLSGVTLDVAVYYLPLASPETQLTIVK